MHVLDFRILRSACMCCRGLKEGVGRPCTGERGRIHKEVRHKWGVCALHNSFSQKKLYGCCRSEPRAKKNPLRSKLTSSWPLCACNAAVQQFRQCLLGCLHMRTHGFQYLRPAPIIPYHSSPGRRAGKSADIIIIKACHSLRSITPDTANKAQDNNRCLGLTRWVVAYMAI